jgi:hypothetical protein
MRVEALDVYLPAIQAVLHPPPQAIHLRSCIPEDGTSAKQYFSGSHGVVWPRLISLACMAARPARLP